MRKFMMWLLVILVFISFYCTVYFFNEMHIGQVLILLAGCLGKLFYFDVLEGNDRGNEPLKIVDTEGD